MAAEWLDFTVPRADWLAGRATPIGTAAHMARASSPAPRTRRGLRLASIGLGTGGFRPTAAAPAAREAITVAHRAIARGINVLDTATNYGQGFAEVAVGHALRAEVAAGGASRDGVFVVSKAGYRPHAGGGDAGEDTHCIEPEFLDGELEASRRRLGVETIDAYLLHNPEEQFGRRPEREAWRALRRAFAFLETAVRDGRIGVYGISFADGIRPGGRPGQHRLSLFLRAAIAVGGPAHHCCVLELPVSLWRREAFTSRSERARSRSKSTLEVAAAAEMVVLATGTMNGGHTGDEACTVARRLLGDLSASDALVALQFARSVPGVTTALAGVTHLSHLEELLTLCPLSDRVSR